MSAESFHQAIGSESRRLLARLPHIDHRCGGIDDDKRGEHQAEQKKRDS
jgi:hypothetical protein